MPINLYRNDPALWEERTRFIERLKRVIPFCEFTFLKTNLAVHEFLVPYSKKYKPEANRLFLLHPANVVVIHNDIHIRSKPEIEDCIKKVEIRSLDACREFGFGNGKMMLSDFKQKVIELKQARHLKLLPKYILSL